MTASQRTPAGTANLRRALMVLMPTRRHGSRTGMLALALFVSPKGAVASDFSPIMWLLLIPFAAFAGLVFLVTLLCTRHMKRPWARTTIRIAVGCMVLTPTYTRGGNGQSLSVAGYDILLSAFGGDPVYATQAMANAGVATLALLALLWASKRFR